MNQINQVYISNFIEEKKIELIEYLKREAAQKEDGLFLGGVGGKYSDLVKCIQKDGSINFISPKRFNFNYLDELPIEELIILVEYVKRL